MERTVATDAMAKPDFLVARVRGEYCEMPLTCEMLLEQLVHEDFLCKTEKGACAAATTARRRL